MESNGLPSNLEEIRKEYPAYSYLCKNCLRVVDHRQDFRRGVVFCEACGYVNLETHIGVQKDPYHEDVHIVDLFTQYNKPYTINTINDIKHLQSMYEPHHQCKQDYRIASEYKPHLDVIAGKNYFDITKTQKEEVLFLIKKANGVKEFCKNCNYELVILALVVMVIRNNGRDINLDTNKLIKESGLTYRNYITILERANKVYRK